MASKSGELAVKVLEIWSRDGELPASPHTSALASRQLADDKAATEFYRMLSEALWELASAPGFDHISLRLHRLSVGWPVTEDPSDADVDQGLASVECQSKTQQGKATDDDVARLQLRLLSQFNVQSARSGKGFIAHMTSGVAKPEGTLWHSLTRVCESLGLREIDVMVGHSDTMWLDCVRLRSDNRPAVVANVKGVSDMPPVFGTTILLFFVHGPDQTVVGRA